MNTRTPAAISLCAALLLSACAQPGNGINVENKGSMFFGRDSHYNGAQEMPMYSNNYRATQDTQIASKYKTTTHEYGLAAAVPEVSASELSAPDPVAISSLEAPASDLPVTSYPSPSAPAQVSNVKNDLEVAMLEPLNLESESTVAAAAKAPPMESIHTRSSNFIWPSEGEIISGYGSKPNGLVNDGINIRASEGEPIWSAAKGEVVYAGNELKGYGNMVIIRHENNWMTAYAHASDFIVKKGDKVGQGDLIGYVGSTGNVQEAQLHFGIREGKRHIDPETLLPRRFAGTR